MKSVRILIVVCLGGIAACNPQDLATPGEDDQSIALPSDEMIMQRVYDLLYQHPSDFLVDERADTPRSYTVYHVKDDSTSYELCVDTMDAAVQLETADNAQRPVNGVYVETIETEEYFEVVRELSYPNGIGNISETTSPGFARVFKCDYTMPLTERVVRKFTQYQWQFTFFWPAIKTVLDTYSTEGDNAIEHTLLLAFRTSQGGGTCDLIEVVEWTFSADRTSGRIRKDFDALYSFEAQLVDGMPQKCAG